VTAFHQQERGLLLDRLKTSLSAARSFFAGLREGKADSSIA